MSEEIQVGDRVRVSKNCPLTLPHYARVLIGTVQGPSEDGLLLVDFGERTYPLDPTWLEKIPPRDDDTVKVELADDGTKPEGAAGGD